MPSLTFEILAHSQSVTRAFMRITRPDGQAWNPGLGVFQPETQTGLYEGNITNDGTVRFDIPYDPDQFPYGDYRAIFFAEEDGVVTPSVSGIFWLIPEPWSDAPYASRTGDIPEPRAAGF